MSTKIVKSQHSLSIWVSRLSFLFYNYEGINHILTAFSYLPNMPESTLTIIFRMGIEKRRHF